VEDVQYAWKMDGLLISSGQQKNKWYSPPSQCMEFSKLQICIQGEPQAGLSSG